VLLDRREGGLKEPSMINLVQVLALDKVLLMKRLGSVRAEKLSVADAAIRVALGLET